MQHMRLPSGRAAVRALADLNAASRDVTEPLTTHLRDHATKRGWPAEAVKHLHVEYADGAFHPRYHEAGKELVERLEYGHLDVRPNAALRSWAARSGEYSARLHDAAMFEALGGEL